MKSSKLGCHICLQFGLEVSLRGRATFTSFVIVRLWEMELWMSAMLFFMGYYFVLGDSQNLSVDRWPGVSIIGNGFILTDTLVTLA